MGGARGSGDSSVVLADRFGCRSRQAARGPSRPRVMNPRIHDGSSSSVREHSRRANKRRKPGLGGKAGGPVAGSLQTERALRKQRSLLGALVDGRRSEPGKPLSLARGRGKRFWFLERGSGSTDSGNSRGATGSVRGVRRQPRRGRKSRDDRERRPERCSALLRNERAAVSDGAEARCAPSSADRLGVGTPKGRPAPAARRALRATSKGWTAAARDAGQ